MRERPFDPLAAAEVSDQIPARRSASSLRSPASLARRSVSTRLSVSPHHSCRRGVKAIYEELSGKDKVVFAYLSISLPTHLIDHNIDPTKMRLSVQDESTIIAQITAHIKVRFESLTPGR